MNSGGSVFVFRWWIVSSTPVKVVCGDKATEAEALIVC
ncbi:hypothetical protein HM1_0542 [Heliomicrobium modesticaldum Ice1]|uniref:Uncharacterized protein n=1 Tax=Heliobacterium modesticaldum (strain ATCC 51547 / Ice1) TaxID=498761 RepID=B0TFZ9_HELMI|nr:hypothetical protein HM1_0542 [Heliomicrobium modesticaldum Ice1]